MPALYLQTMVFRGEPSGNLRRGLFFTALKSGHPRARQRSSSCMTIPTAGMTIRWDQSLRLRPTPAAAGDLALGEAQLCR
jgi:hypothetical protein